MNLKIQIIPSANIDRIKWDDRVQASENGLIYSTTSYLDALCEHWHGMIIGDHQWIMALPWKQKWGIRYAYMPPFLQQTGLIGETNSFELQEAIRSIHSFLSYADLNFNFKNTFDKNPTHFQQRTNLIIPLSSYEKIKINYSKSLLENIQKAENHSLVYDAIDPETAILSFKENYAERKLKILKKEYNGLLEWSIKAIAAGNCFCRKTTDQEGNLLACGLFLKDSKRIYNIMNTTVPKGRELEANHFLLDRVIREFSSKGLIFDLEGSDLPGVQHFYRSFGAIDQPYLQYHFNKLPWPISLFKH
jgi:hypothetical protein